MSTGVLSILAEQAAKTYKKGDAGYQIFLQDLQGGKIWVLPADGAGERLGKIGALYGPQADNVTLREPHEPQREGQ